MERDIAHKNITSVSQAVSETDTDKNKEIKTEEQKKTDLKVDQEQSDIKKPFRLQWAHVLLPVLIVLILALYCVRYIRRRQEQEKVDKKLLLSKKNRHTDES